MKEFEKWFNNFSCDIIDCGGIGCDDICKQIRKETWKAALERIRYIVIHESDGPSNPKSLIEWIDEELLSDQTDNSGDQVGKILTGGE